jgi:hypothetical protein
MFGSQLCRAIGRTVRVRHIPFFSQILSSCSFGSSFQHCQYKATETDDRPSEESPYGCLLDTSIIDLRIRLLTPPASEKVRPQPWATISVCVLYVYPSQSRHEVLAGVPSADTKTVRPFVLGVLLFVRWTASAIFYIGYAKL